MAIRTIEDGFQYRVHYILKPFKENFEADKASGFLDENISFEDYLSINGKSLSAAFLDDIDKYCGLNEAIENEY